MHMTLPGTVAQQEAIDIPDEQRITISDNGQIILNDLPLDKPDSTELTALLATLKRFKESADANKTEALITLDVSDNASHQRVVDVLNACANAGISGVTFAGAEQEEE
jgi:biopolymer transport protein ExbD